VVVGVSNEPTGLLEKHIEKKGIAYPIAKTKGGDIDKMYGVKGFPSGAIVDPYGRIVWMGNPGGVPRSQIEELLALTSFVPTIDDDDYKKINKLILAQDFGKALAELDKLLVKDAENELLTAAKGDIDGLLERKLEQADAATQSGDYGLAVAIYADVQTFFKGTQAAKDAKLKQKAVEKDPAAKDELAAAKKMAKGDEAQMNGDFEKAAKVYKGIVKKFPETKCAERAQAFLRRHGSL